MPTDPTTTIVVFGFEPDCRSYHRNRDCNHLMYDDRPNGVGRVLEEQAQRLGYPPCQTCARS